MERRIRPRRVLQISLMLLFFDLVHRCRDPLVLEIEVTSFGALVGAGGEKDLQSRIGKDDAADVSPLHDTSLGESDSTLNRHQSPANPRNRRHGRSHQGAFWSTDGVADILTVNQNPDRIAITLELDGMPRGELGDLVLHRIGEREIVPGANRHQPNRPIHGPGVEVGDLEPARQEARHR